MWGATEKIHGCNFSFIYDGVKITPCRRTSALKDDDKFFNHLHITNKYKNIVLEVTPFHWNGAEFEISPPIQNDEKLQIWAMQWLYPDKNTDTDAWGLGNYIHVISPPETIENKSVFTVDFGSANIKSLTSLLDLFSELGATKVKIHSNAMIPKQEISEYKDQSQR